MSVLPLCDYKLSVFEEKRLLVHVEFEGGDEVVADCQAVGTFADGVFLDYCFRIRMSLLSKSPRSVTGIPMFINPAPDMGLYPST